MCILCSPLAQVIGHSRPSKPTQELKLPRMGKRQKLGEDATASSWIDPSSAETLGLAAPGFKVLLAVSYQAEEIQASTEEDSSEGERIIKSMLLKSGRTAVGSVRPWFDEKAFLLMVADKSKSEEVFAVLRYLEDVDFSVENALEEAGIEEDEITDRCEHLRRRMRVQGESASAPPAQILALSPSVDDTAGAEE